MTHSVRSQEIVPSKIYDLPFHKPGDENRSNVCKRQKTENDQSDMCNNVNNTKTAPKSSILFYQSKTSLVNYPN